MKEQVSTAMTYAGSGSAFVFGLSPSEWSVIGVIGGLVIGVAGLLANLYFGYQRMRMDKEKDK